MKIKNNFKEGNFGKFGIEEEFQIVNPETFDLAPKAKELLDELNNENFSDELFLSTIETHTPLCKTIDDARRHVYNLRKSLRETANRHGVLISSAGTHPFTDWKKQLINPKPRYLKQMKENNGLNQLEVTYGLHIHLGVENIRQSMRLYHNFREFIPYIISLSANSPFWVSKRLHNSTRLYILDQVPQYGYPKKMKTWKEYYNNLVELSSVYESIKSEKDVFWDVRLRPNLGTIEIRVLDAQTDRKTTLALTALILLIGTHFKDKWLDLKSSHEFRKACIKKGIRVLLGDKKREQIVNNLLDETQFTQNELGINKEIKIIRDMIKKGKNPADKQVELYNQKKSFPELVKELCKITIS